MDKVSFNPSFHDINHYIDEILTQMRQSLDDFLVTEPGYTDWIYISSQDESIDLADLVDDVKRALIINLYETYETDIPKDDDWIHHSYDQWQSRKRKYGAILDRMLFVNDEEQLMLPGLNYGSATSFDDVERTLEKLILRITSNSLEIDFFQVQDFGILRLIDEGRPRYFLKDSTIQDNVYQILCVDLPGILEELGYSADESKAVIAAKDILRTSVESMVESFDYNSSSLNISLAGSSDLVELALRLRFSPEFLKDLSARIIGIEAQEIANAVGIVIGKAVIRRVSSNSGIWNFSEFSNGQVQNLSEPEYCGDWISALCKHLGGSVLTFNLEEIASNFGQVATTGFYSLDLSGTRTPFEARLKQVYKVNLITQ